MSDVVARTPYYQDESVTLYHGDCLDWDDEASWWLDAEVLITDPPYGRGWTSGAGLTNSEGNGSSSPHAGIANDSDTTTRDAALARWGPRKGIVFGDLLIEPPARAVQCLVYAKPADAGIRGARGGFRRDVEAIYLIGPWTAGIGGRSSVLTTGGRVAGPRGMGLRSGHPHCKPVDLMEQLVALTDGTVADPFAGSGSTLVAARNLGRKAIGVEIEERYCELIAKRLAQGCLDFGDAS